MIQRPSVPNLECALRFPELPTAIQKLGSLGDQLTFLEQKNRGPEKGRLAANLWCLDQIQLSSRAGSHSSLASSTDPPFRILASAKKKNGGA